LREFIALLSEVEVRYLIVGGYAVAMHGHARYTKQLDVWIWTDRDNTGRLVQVLDRFGFASLGLSIQDFVVEEQLSSSVARPIGSIYRPGWTVSHLKSVSPQEWLSTSMEWL
jgi:hypothetical protein